MLQRVAVGISVIAAITSSSFGSIQYSVVGLGLSGGVSSSGYALNASGQVVGDLGINLTTQHAAFFAGNSVQDMGAFGDSIAIARSINDSGQILCDTQLSSGAGVSPDHAFIYSNGAFVNIGTLGGLSANALQINDTGEVAGTSAIITGENRAFFYDTFGMHDLGTLGGSASAAFAINDLDQIVGNSALANHSTHPFLYTDGSMHDLGTLGGAGGTAMSINAAGDIVGDSNAADGTLRAFLYVGGAMHNIDSIHGTFSIANSINNSDQIVGVYGRNNVNHAFLYFNNSMIDLNTLIPVTSGWTLSTASQINDVGQIVGTGIDPNGSQRAFLLTPIAAPEPSSLMFIALALLAAGRSRCSTFSRREC